MRKEQIFKEFNEFVANNETIKEQLISMFKDYVQDLDTFVDSIFISGRLIKLFNSLCPTKITLKIILSLGLILKRESNSLRQARVILCASSTINSAFLFWELASHRKLQN